MVVISMDAQSPFFSVIIPTYHRNDLLAKCLNCLAPGIQTLSVDHYEIIVTDDGRATTSEQLIREQYPWVKWVAGSGKGPAANRNNGAKYARGEWLVFTDDDCLPDRQWLKAYRNAISSNISVYEGKIICKDGIHSPLQCAPTNTTGGCLWSCNMMVRIEIFNNLGGFDENFPYPHLEDVDFRERVLQSGYQFNFIEEAVVDHPPRRVAWGDRLGLMHESDFYYCYKRKNKNLDRLNLVKSILNNRIRSILKYPFHPDIPLACISLIVELIYTLSNLDRWKEKYLNAYNK